MAIVGKAYKSGVYEAEYERELCDYEGNPIGVKVWIKGLDSADVLRVHNEYLRKIADAQIRGGGDIPEGIVGDLVVSEMRDKYVACITKWDFGDEELFDGEGVPNCDYATKSRFYDIPAFGSQVRAWIAEIEGFTKPSKEG